MAIKNLTTTCSLDERSKALRSLVVRGLEGGNRGHVGSSLSLIEIMSVLYDDFLNYDSARPDLESRDRLIFSKGHGCLALYAILADKGFFPESWLDDFCKNDGLLGGHPEKGDVPGVEASTGALGHGLSLAVGMAIAAKIKKSDHRIVAVCGDGEINEGSVWEAAMCAGNRSLDNLLVMVDYNKIQSYGFTKDVCDLEPLIDKWSAFGFSTLEVDGHDISQLKMALDNFQNNKDQPTAIICHTIKGKGFDFAENEPSWHHKSKFSPEDFLEMKKYLTPLDQ